MSASDGKTAVNILIIDDTPANLAVMVDHLETRGFQVAVAQDGEEGIARAQRIRPDLILLDVMMPGIDGFETCRRLRSIDATRDVPVLFMTALSDGANKVRGFEAGGVDYVTKPFQIEEVLARVDTHLALHATRRSLAEKNTALEAEIAVRMQAQSELARAFAKLEESEDRYRTLVELSPDAILIEREGRIVFANTAAVNLFGAANRDDLLERPLLTLVAPSDRAEAARGIQDLLEGKPARASEERALRFDETAIDVAITRLAFQYQGRPAIQVLARDISESKRLQVQLKHLATHDALTGLPNRVLLTDRLSQALARAKRNHGRFVVALVDLDRFKWINDTFGHDAGDTVLRTMANRIAASLRTSDTLARVGGDEFVILLNDTETLDTAMVALDRVVTNVAKPLILESGEEVSISCSVGCSTYPDDGLDVEDLLKAADAAMYQAKAAGRNNVQMFDADLRSRAELRASLETDLRHAIAREQFTLHYQPQVELRTGRIVGVEALLRWLHPKQGMVPPAQFIALAEAAGLITEVGDWVLDRACAQGKAWRDAGLPPVRIAVNLSAKQLARPGLLEQVERSLAASGMDARCLELELTESASMNDPELTIPLLQKLKDLGVTLAVDDFGTGYSNMQYLTRLPIDRLKLDGAFVREITTNPGDLAIVEAVTVMAHRLGLTVVGEMAETEGQVALLHASGCDVVQGYFFSRAVPADQMATLLAAGAMALPQSVKRLRAERTLLVLDDEALITTAIEANLRDAGYRLLIANHARDAFELLARHPVGVILSDQLMPDMSGVEFLSAVRRLYPNAIRLMFSANSDFKAAISAINHGAVHKFIEKPCEGSELRKVVSEAFQEYESAGVLH